MTATVLSPLFGDAHCVRCGAEISRETRVALAIRTAGDGSIRSWGDLLCAYCDAAPVTTFTEFADYLTRDGFGSVERGWRDPTSPCA